MEDGGRDPPSEDEASESNESQTANEAAISGEPRGRVLVEANQGDIVQVGLKFCTMMGNDSLSLRERVRVRGGAIVSDIFLHRTTNGDHLECSKMHGRLVGGGRGGSEDGGAKNGEWCDDRTRATIAEGMVDIYYCKWDFATRPICFHQAEKKSVVDRHCYPSQLRVPNSFPEKWQMDYKSLIQGGSVVLPSEEASRECVWFLRLFTMTEMNSCVRECVRALQPPMKLETQPPA